MIGAVILALSGLSQIFSCEASSPHTVFMGRNLDIVVTAPANPPMHSSFEISVGSGSVVLKSIDGVPAPHEFKPFIKIIGQNDRQYFSEKSSLFRAGTAEPMVMTLVVSNDKTAKLMTSSPLAVTVHNGPADSAGQMLPAVSSVAAFCSAKENAK